MVDKVQIRPAAATDAPGIERVARCTWNSTYAGIIPAEVQERLLGSYYEPAALQDAIARQGSWFFVATAQEAIIGYAQFHLREGERKSGELSRIYVLPEWQRKGVGSLLLERGLAALQQEGVGFLYVVVERDNLIGRGFYEKQGFNQVREFTVDLAGQNLPMLEYRLDLAPYSG
jgi:ribosomal protein S18 acetylase RimI-like enzyme